MRRACRAFTLTELLVAVAVLTLVAVMGSRMINSAATITTLGNKHMDTDSQVHSVLDRMGLDFVQMIRRSDVDYFVKTGDQNGNDRMAFFSTVAGYYPSSGSQSPLSLIAYRINSELSSASSNKMQRMGKGLLWSSVAPTPSPSPSPSPNPPWIIFGPAGTLPANWPSATTGDPTDQNYGDADYELIGPQIFRFEYFYLLKTGAISDLPGASGMQDVAAIVVALACIDPQSRALISDCQISGNPGCGAFTNNGLVQRLEDFKPATHTRISDLTVSWQATLDGIADMPRVAISSVRIYQRSFYLLPSK